MSGPELLALGLIAAGLVLLFVGIDLVAESLAPRSGRTVPRRRRSSPPANRFGDPG